MPFAANGLDCAALSKLGMGSYPTDFNAAESIAVQPFETHA